MSFGAPAPVVPELPPLDSALQAFLDDYDQYFSNAMLEAGPPGAAVAVVRDSQIVFLKGYGVLTAGGSDLVNSHTVFRIGSLSKGFAGVLTGILVKKGLLDWDDPVHKYYPDFNLKDKKQAQRTKIKHLLSHTTGLPYHAFDNLIEQGFDRETILKQYLKTARLFGREGELYRYQNAAFCVIELVIEAAAGKPYEELLAEYIFNPAHMTSASCDFESMQQRQNKALPHHLTESGWVSDTISRNYYGFTAAGGINASITSMGEWLKILLGQRPDIVTNETLDEVFRPVISTGSERRILPGWLDRAAASYAMGWRILTPGTDTIVYHAGFVNNFHSEIALDRREGIGICVLLNGNSPIKGNVIQHFFQQWKKPETDSLPPVQ